MERECKCGLVIQHDAVLCVKCAEEKATLEKLQRENAQLKTKGETE